VRFALFFAGDFNPGRRCKIEWADFCQSRRGRGQDGPIIPSFFFADKMEIVLPERAFTLLAEKLAGFGSLTAPNLMMAGKRVPETVL